MKGVGGKGEGKHGRGKPEGKGKGQGKDDFGQVLYNRGVINSFIGTEAIRTNSLHGQAVNQLAPGLQVEALSPDGVVEAFSVTDAAGFNLCVQWHPEWQAADNPESMRMLRAFGDAVRSRHALRTATAAVPAP